MSCSRRGTGAYGRASHIPPMQPARVTARFPPAHHRPATKPPHTQSAPTSRPDLSSWKMEPAFRARASGPPGVSKERGVQRPPVYNSEDYTEYLRKYCKFTGLQVRSHRIKWASLWTKLEWHVATVKIVRIIFVIFKYLIAFDQLNVKIYEKLRKIWWQRGLTSVWRSCTYCMPLAIGNNWLTTNHTIRLSHWWQLVTSEDTYRQAVKSNWFQKNNNVQCRKTNDNYQ